MRTPLRPGSVRAAAGALLVALALGGAARADHIRTLDAEIDDDVLSIEGEPALVLKTTGGRTIPAEDVKEIRFGPEGREARPAATRLFLVGGDEIAGEVSEGDEGKVSVRTTSLGAIEVDLESVRAVAYTADEADLRRFRREVLPLDAKKDLAVTRSWALQEGILERVGQDGIRFSTSALGSVTLGSDKIIGARVRQFGKTGAAAGLRARLELADGSTLEGKVRRFKGGVFLLDAAFKPALEVGSAEVRALSFSGGRIVYVSDLAPRDVEERAKLISLVFKHREDASVLGNPLKLDGRPYRKGIGVHAYTRLVYAADQKFARLRAVIGLDDEARERRDVIGTVRFQVLLDGKPALGESGVLLTSRDSARPIDLDVAGAKTVALVADFGESEDTLSRGAWADAYFVRK